MRFGSCTAGVAPEGIASVGTAMKGGREIPGPAAHACDFSRGTRSLSGGGEEPTPRS